MAVKMHGLVPATIVIAFVLLPVPALAQSLDLGVNEVGVSLGNSPRWTGLRINWRDANVERVNGINLTIWKPDEESNDDFVMNGLALGVFGPNAEVINGAAAGIGGVIANRTLNGVAVGGLGVVSQGDMGWLNVASLGVVAEGRLRGLSIAGLGAVAQGGISGITVAGAGIVAAEADIRGASITLGEIRARATRGLNVAGYRIKGDDARGINLSLIRIQLGRMSGVAVAGYNDIDEQRGLSIGIYNRTEDLRGVQIGVLNYAANAAIKWTPIVNARF